MLANERGASAHTLRAYRRELEGFAAWMTEASDGNDRPDRIEHTHIRAYLGTLYERGLSKARQRARWRRSAAGSSGWRGPATSSRMRPRWFRRRSCPSICRACRPSSR